MVIGLRRGGVCGRSDLLSMSRSRIAALLFVIRSITLRLLTPRFRSAITGALISWRSGRCHKPRGGRLFAAPAVDASGLVRVMGCGLRALRCRCVYLPSLRAATHRLGLRASWPGPGGSSGSSGAGLSSGSCFRWAGGLAPAAGSAYHVALLIWIVTRLAATSSRAVDGAPFGSSASVGQRQSGGCPGCLPMQSRAWSGCMSPRCRHPA